MTDRFDEMAEIVLIDMPLVTFSDLPTRAIVRRGIATALRAQHKAGQKAMREKAATVAGTLAETTYDNEPEFSAVTDVEAAIRALPIEDTP